MVRNGFNSSNPRSMIISDWVMNVSSFNSASGSLELLKNYFIYNLFKKLVCMIKFWQEILELVPFEFKTPDLKGFPCKYPGFPLLSSSCVPFFLSLDQKWSYPKVWVKTKTSLVLLLNCGEKFVTSIKTWTSAIPSCPLWCIWYFNLVKIFSQFYNKDICIFKNSVFYR